jgi:hypothetical protein
MSYKTLDPQDFLVSADTITAPCWTSLTNPIIALYTSSVQIAGTSGNYYLNVYNANPTLTSSADIQFNIAYGNAFGSGSLLYDAGINGLSPSRTVYGQFRNLIYGDENTQFSFSSVTPVQQDFYSITIDRARFKESLFPGSLNLTLYSASKQINLTDNSLDTTTITYCDAGRVFQIVSGSNGTAVTTANSALGAVSNGMTPSGSYGLFLPDIGTIILNASALDLQFASGGIALNTVRTSNTNAANPVRLFTTGSGTRGLTTGSITSSFSLNSQETITSDFVFCRARNAEFNYTENPSFISGSTGAVLYDLFINSPTTYITTVGLYNDSNELLAVAKLSKPLKKDFTKEALVRVKLDF